MKNYIYFFLTLILFTIPTHIFAQNEVEVADLTIEIGTKDEKILYYTFEKGDDIVFSMTEINGKELKEIEISEYPSNSKYKNYKIKRIEEKKIKVNKRGIYAFRLYNSHSLAKRVCRISIKRVPKLGESLNFNTGVDWVEKFDTTYEIKTENVVTGYNTVNKQRAKRVLVSVDTNIVSVVDRRERVHSSTNLENSNTSYITVNIPKNQYYPNEFLPYQSTEVISCAYSLFVGETNAAWYKNANKKASAIEVTNLATNIGLMTSGYSALAVLAIEGVSLFSNPPSGDNVKFNMLTSYNGTNYSLGYGNSVAASGRIDKIKQGSFSLKLLNDNYIDAINVDVKIIAITVTKKWKDEYYTVQKKEPIKEKITKKIPKVSVTKVPVMIEDE